MPSTPSLIRSLKTDYPDVVFEKAEQFTWSPATNTLFYNPKLPNAAELILHELSHGLLGHSNYQRDIELLAMEVAAWEKAKVLASKYSLILKEQVAQDHLDTYRDWMHARSSCPECKAIGYQTAKAQYTCAACGHRWRVNEARLCGLKRYKL